MKILYFDLCAMLIIVILVVAMLFRRKQGGRTNNMLVVIWINVFFTTIFDFCSEAYNLWVPAEEMNFVFLNILFYGYFLSRNLTPLVYQFYICSVTDTWHIVKAKKWLQVLFVAPYLGVCLLLSSNLFCHNVFYFDQDMVYTRGPLFYGLHFCAFIYLVIGISYLCVYRKVLTREKLLVLMSMYPWNVVAIMIQAFIPEYLVEMFLNTISLVLVTNVVQRSEEMINPLIGIRSHISFTSDMKKVFILQKPVQIFVAKIVNYHSLLTILGYETCNSLMKQISDNLQESVGTKPVTADLYYLENGLFAVTSENVDSSFFRELTQKFSNEIKGNIQMGKMELELNSCLCVFSCPQDFEEYDKMLSFVNNFFSYFPADGTVTYLEDEQDKQKTMFQLRNEIDGIVSKAIEENRFEMYYQPIYSIRKKRFLSAEALIRLKDDKYGFISPELFITAAEKNGTILQIGEFVLDSVCSFLAECSQMGVPVDYIELNLSMKQCMQKDLVDKVFYYIKKYNLTPEQINLEVTETAANTAQDIVEDNICELTKRGISFSLDDYGTGYSNLSRFMSLPFQIVKIDKSMTDKVFDSKMKTILKYNIQLLKEIGMEIVVEGVENEEVLKQFEEMECEYIQGYYFSKPLPKNEFVEFVKRNNQS